MKRNRWWAVLAVTAALCWSAGAQGLGSAFEEGNALYRQGDFKAAAEAYRKALAENITDGAAHFNLGNALFRLGQTGPALAAYRRAERLMPRDADVAWNIGVVRSMAVDRLELSDEWLVFFWVRQAAHWAARHEAAFALAAAVAGIFLFNLVLLLLPKTHSIVRTFKNLFVAAAVLAALLVAFHAWQEREPAVVVTDPEVYVRYGPSAKETKAFLLHEGAEGRIGDSVNDWVFVKFGKNSGWIPRKSCEII